MRQRVQRINGSSIADRCEISNSHRVLLGSDSHIVPDGGPLADDDFADEGGVGGDPGALHLWDLVVEGHDLAVAR